MTDPTIIELEPAVALFKHDWVHDFFFKTTPSDTLEQLNYALNSPCTMTGDLSISSDARPQPQPQPYSLGDTIRESIKFLIAPSFTTGNITVGFDVTDRLFTTCPVLSQGKSLSRVVRDDEQGIFLSMSENEDTGLTELSFCTQLSPGCRCMIFMVLDTKAFWYITTKKFDAQLVQKNLVYSLYSLDVRSCPICNAQTFINCMCKLKLRRKKHPLDYDAELRNIVSYVGAFEGGASLRIYKDGKASFVGNFLSNINTTVSGDAYFKQTMGLWAMQNATKNCSMNLVKLSVPDEGQGAEDRLKDMRNGLFGGPVEEFLPGNSGELRLCDEEIMRLITGLHDDSASESDAISASEMIASMYASDADTPNITCSERLTSSVEGVNDPVSEDVIEKRTEKDMENLSANRSSSRPPNTSEDYVPNQAVGPSITADPRGGANEQAYVVEHITARRLVPLAPATGFSSVRPSTFAQELQRRAEVRKVRNRASALRSNEKKRDYLKKLKEDIDAAGKLEAALRAKEKALREENLKLRAIKR